MQLVATGLSKAGYVTATTIMGLENVLDQVENWQMDWGRERGRDPQLYWLKVFGEPVSEGPWSWRFGGHHVSVQHSVWSVTKETDLVVFHPHYPEKLREKSSVLASGVAAAFSCKRTIDRAAIKEAYEDADTLRRGMTIRGGTPRQHLAPPVFVGLLGGGHGWKNDDPKQKIKAILDEFDKEVETPRLGLDMMCIADLGYWVRSTSIFPEKYMKQQSEQVTEILGKEALVFSAMRHKYDDPQPLAPVTNFIGSLWGKLALNDKSLTPLADGFRITNTYPSSGQLAFKRWKLADLVTPFMVDNVRRGFIPNSDWQYLY